MSSQAKQWNPRYVCYARAHGKGPQEMLDSTRGMHGFICWINTQWSQWHKLTGHPGHLTPHTRQQHRDFDAWLLGRTAAMIEWDKNEFNTQPTDASRECLTGEQQPLFAA